MGGTVTDNLTDADIDTLGGVAMDEAVCRALGWHTEFRDGRILWHCPGVPFMYDRPKRYRDDIAAAMSLLMEFGGVRISIEKTTVTIECPRRVLAHGSKSELATLACRAWMKLQNRKG
jgi:hypothetical protein